MEPILVARAGNVPPGDLRDYFEGLLGEPEPELLERFQSIIVNSTVSMTPVQDNVLAYALHGDDGVYALIVDFRDPGTRFMVLFGSR